jgi:tetratricopeptide (TPR) repeat protein
MGAIYHRIMGCGVLSGTFAIFLLVGAALADPIADCSVPRNTPEKIVACTAVIANPSSTTEQKAIAFRNRGLGRAEAAANEHAEQDFTEALKLDASDAAALSGRALVRMTRKDTAAAIEDFNAAIKLKPENPQYLMGRGYAHLVKGDSASAITDFSEVIRFNPKHASAFNHRGLAHRKAGDNARAIADYSSAIGLNPAYALAYNNRGYVYESNGQKAQAIADFNRALSLDRSLTGAADGLKRFGASGALAAETDAYVKEGKQMVEAKCSGCHAVGLTGDSPNPRSPPFRKLFERHPGLALREPLSRGIAAPHEDMPNFKLTDQQIDRIIAYVNSFPETR